MKPLWETSSQNAQNVGHVLKCKLTVLQKERVGGHLKQIWITRICFSASLDQLHHCSLSQVQRHKGGLLFHKSSPDKWHSSGCWTQSWQPAWSLHSSLLVLFTSTAISLLQDSAFTLTRDKETITVEILCMQLISLFRVNEKASFCTNKSLHEFYWISKTKMFLCTPCPHFTSVCEGKLSKMSDMMTSKFPPSLRSSGFLLANRIWTLFEHHTFLWVPFFSFWKLHCDLLNWHIWNLGSLLAKRLNSTPI